MPSIYFKPIEFAILAVATAIALLSMTSYSESQDYARPLVWTESAMEAIAIDRPAPALTVKNRDRLSQIQLSAAQGEFEAFQIVVQAPSGTINDVNIVVSDLESSDGSRITRDNIALFREHYIQLDRPSPSNWRANPTRGKGLYADALIPFVDPDTGKDIEGAELDAVPFSLKSGLNQPIWVDIFVPRDTVPGKYRGTYTVESDRETVRGKIDLNVWNFELPVEPSMNSFFDIWEDRGLEAQTLLLKHRLMPSQRIPYEDPVELQELGIKSVRLPFWSGANYQTCKMDPSPTVAEFESAAAKFPSNVLKYVFAVDEIDKCVGLEKPLKQWSKNIHQAKLKHLAVMKPKPELYDSVDIWVVNPRMFAEAKKEIAEVRQQGDDIWFYTGYSTSYSPLWHLDSAPINWRIPQGWIAQSLDLKGVLLSRVDTWTREPWKKVPIYEQGKKDYPGVEMLIYPGDEVGLDRVVPSIRLKRLREGMEDYEYTQILKNLGHYDWAMNVVRRVGKNWGNWTKDPDTLYKARRKLGDKIHQLSTS